MLLGFFSSRCCLFGILVPDSGCKSMAALDCCVGLEKLKKHFSHQDYTPNGLIVTKPMAEVPRD